MAPQPCQQSFIIQRPRRDGKDRLNQFVIFIRTGHMIDVQKNQHCMDADSLVSVQKRVVLNQSKPKPRSFFQYGGIELNPPNV